MGIFYLLLLTQFVLPRNRTHLQAKEALKPLGFGVIDAICNIVNIAAYEYSDAASINLILTLVLPFSMLFSRLLLKRQYTYPQIVSCIVAVIFVIIYGYIDSRNSYPMDNKALGDALAAVAAFGYGFETVYNERFAKTMSIS